MVTANRIVGNRGEDAACDFLISKGQTILARNWTRNHLEVDIITLDRAGVHFVEVKSRTAPVMAAPEENVGIEKQRCLCRAARSFLKSPLAQGLDRDAELLFDIVSVTFHPDHTDLDYFPQAFIPIFL